MTLPDFSKNFADRIPPGTADSGKGVAQPEKEVPQQSPTKKIDIRYIFAVLLLVIAIVSTGLMFGLNVYLDREIVSIEGGVEALEDAIKVNDILGYATFDKQVQTLKGLAVSRGGYSLLLSEVSRLVVPGVYYSSISIDSQGEEYTLVVRGVANSLREYHQQIQRIETTEGLLENGSFDGYALQRDEGSVVTVSFTVSFVIPVASVSEVLNSLS